MKNQKNNFLILLTLTILIFSCTQETDKKKQTTNQPKPINLSHFTKPSDNFKIEKVDCTLSTGEKSKCLKITTTGFSANHKMGPWCPDKITDSKDRGGIWFKDGKIYDVDGAFVQNLAKLYNDDKWMMYDEQGNVKKTKTKADCQKLAGAQLIDEYTNFCIECLPSYVSDLNKTYTIPIQPTLIEDPTLLNKPKGPPPGGKDAKGPRPSGGRGGGPSVRGVSLSGIAFDAPAPVNLILSGYTIPPLDDAGGHVNMDAGYHYHAATGLTMEVKQQDGHAPLIGYAMDGIALYAQKNPNGSSNSDLDECRGHYDEVRGYHYHVDGAGNNNFINCFSGAIAD